MSEDGRQTLDARIEAEVAAIETMDLEALRRLWRQRIGPPPKLRSTPFLKMHLTWRIQADAYGGLDVDARRSLRGGETPNPAKERLEVGTVIKREWKGILHEVEVSSGGYLYGGETYRSLSVIARQITGARWNGPRFFGLREGVA